MWGIWSEFERNKTIVLGIHFPDEASIRSRLIFLSSVSGALVFSFPPRQTRRRQGELEVITIRHHKIVLRGVAHIKLVFWIAFLWELKNFIPQLLKLLFFNIHHAKVLFGDDFELPERPGARLARPRPRLIISGRLTLDTHEARTICRQNSGDTGRDWLRMVTDSASLLSVMSGTCDVRCYRRDLVWDASELYLIVTDRDHSNRI